jgi:hypothetical protein
MRDLRHEECPDWVETEVHCFEDHRSIGLRQLWKVEQNIRLNCVRYRRLLEENMLSSADHADGPLEVQCIGERNQHAIDIGIVENF